MEDREIKSFLTYPDRPLVEHAVTRANLTAHERQAIDMRVLDKRSIESAAELLLVSDTTIKNRFNSGMDKLNACWSGLPWVHSILTDYQKNNQWKQ